MRILFLLGLINLLHGSLAAQVAKVNIAEHFTNSNCSICATNNPTIYNDLAAYSGTLHMAIHPSSPYAACYFSMQNPVENDARTQFYGIYGSTPKIVLNGSLIAYSSLSPLLSTMQNDSSQYSLSIQQQWISSDSVQVKVSIKKVANDTTTQALLFLAVTQDTVQKLTANGESIHFDVFRKSITSPAGNILNLPLAVNDSVIEIFGYKMQTNWSPMAIKATGILQQVSNKKVIQAHRSAAIAAPSGITPTNQPSITIYPNPANQAIYLKSWKEYQQISMFTVDGRWVLTQPVVNETMDISSLPEGSYRVLLQSLQGELFKSVLQIKK